MSSASPESASSSVLPPDVFRDAFATESAAVLLIDAESGRVAAANAAAAAFADPGADLVGRPFASVRGVREQPELVRALSSVAHEPMAGRTVLLEQNGIRQEWVLTARSFISAGRRWIHCELREVTPERIRQRRAQQARKMESVRLLASSTAHDFNNVLSCIRGYVSIALESAALNAELREILTRVKDVSVRAGELPQRLLDFSRIRKLPLKPVELNAFVRSLVPELRAALPGSVALEVATANEPLWVQADDASLRLVLTLLLRNAREAIGEQPGRVEISTDRWTLSSHAASPGVGSGEVFARIRLRDSGRGMTPDVQERLFEPGFTTKKSARSSGMGLPIVYRITADHGGWVDVESGPARGSMFALLLPVANRPA